MVFLLFVSFLQVPQIQTYAITPLTHVAQERISNAIALYIGSPEAYVYNEARPIDDTNNEVKPFIKNSRALVPVRFISQSFGANVEWNPKTNTATVRLGSNVVKLSLKSNKIYVNNIEKTLDTPAESINGRTYIPLRALVEALNKKVFYDRGLFVTNYHVIEDGVNYKIVTNQNKELDVAGIVKQDKIRDLAILKSKSLPDLQPLNIGSKDMAVKGDTIVTIGSPVGLQNTVSDGIVSGFRSIDNTDYIQLLLLHTEAREVLCSI